MLPIPIFSYNIVCFLNRFMCQCSVEELVLSLGLFFDTFVAIGFTPFNQKHFTWQRVSCNGYLRFLLSFRTPEGPSLNEDTSIRRKIRNLHK